MLGWARRLLAVVVWLYSSGSAWGLQWPGALLLVLVLGLGSQVASEQVGYLMVLLLPAAEFLWV